MANIEPNINDTVKSPKHYISRVPGIECIDVAKWFNFNLGNVIKYIWRSGLKDKDTEIEDLLKARQYIDFEIERLNSLNTGNNNHD